MSTSENNRNGNGGIDTLFRQVLGGLLIATCSASLGYGYSQSSVVAIVQGHTVKIDSVKEQIAITNQRIDTMAQVLKEVVQQNTALVALVRAQQQIVGK